MKLKDEQFHALILGGSKGDAHKIEKMFAEAQKSIFKVAHAENFSKAQAALNNESVDLVILDLENADTDSIFNELTSIAASWPVLVLVDDQDDDLAWQSMHRGAQDFLVKGHFDSALLLRTVRHSMVRHNIMRRLNEVAYEAQNRESQLGAIQKKMAQDQGMLNVVLSQLAGIVWTTDRDLRLSMIMGSGLARLNLRPEQMVGQKLADVFSAGDSGAAVTKAHQAALADESVRYDFEWNGYSYEAALLPIFDEEKRIIGVAGVAMDVTERKILEEQFKASQKMEAIGRLAGGIAHDFNNLLTVIINYAQLILNQVTDETVRTRLDAIANCAQRAASLTGQLLSFSRQHATKAQSIDVNVVLSSIDQMLRRVIGEDIELNILLASQIGKISTDPNQILHIVMNLAINARESMPQGGNLTIETRNVELDAGVEKIHRDVTPGEYVMLAISDSGMGMDKATSERIFEPFFTANNSGQNGGAGLSFIHNIVKQCGGHIWVYSELGQGTTFKIYFQRADAPMTSTPVLKKEPQPAPAVGETVLVVEDEDVVRQVACDIIRRGGYRVIEATNAISALDICEHEKEAIDLVLTDLVMPKMNGPELVKRLAAKHPKLRVVFMSGYTSDAATNNGSLEPPAAFVQKPFMPKTLLETIRGVLDNRTS